jgi:diadenosine tetraphosphate (Ap4A) HIT family hydrolase
MKREKCENKCFGCMISNGQEKNVKKRGGIIKLKGDWILNHYGSSESFLGWLTLQPKNHLTYLSELSKYQASSLVTNIQNIDKALHDYWGKYFGTNELLLIYTVFLFESFLEKELGTCHLHLHLIPRTRSLDELKIFNDVTCNTKTGNMIIEKLTTTPTGWRIYLASKHPDFPSKYKVPSNKRGNKKASDLMKFLRKHLSTTDSSS